MLNAVHDMREQASKPNYSGISKICHTLSMLYFVLDDIAKVTFYDQVIVCDHVVLIFCIS